MNTFHLKILEANSPFFEGECESLIFPDADGFYGVQAHHSDMIAAVSTGIVSFRFPGGEEHLAAVSDGIIKVENNTVLILVNTAESPDEIDENRALRAAEEAREILLQKRSDVAYKAARDKIARELARVKVKSYQK